jgi:hypothetical protein
LQPVVDELLTAARQQPANVDETSMGTDYRRVLTSDRHSKYSH